MLVSKTDMGILRYYNTTEKENQKLISQNKDIINAYNFHILKIFLFLSVAVCFVLSLLSMIPGLDSLNQYKYQLFFSISLGVFFVFSVISLIAGEFVARHSIFAMYTLIIMADTFSVVVNLLGVPPSPYTVTLGFLILVPMLMMDSRSRVIVVNGIVLVVVLMLSYYFKSDDYFMADTINCITFSAVGVFAGDRFRMHNIRYIDLKEHELDRNIEVLRAKNEAKTAFLANMSHEIRTPINAVLGLNEMILRESTEQNVLTYAGDIKNAGKTLLALINDILDFSKIEANRMVIIPTEYQLDSMVNDLVNMTTPRAKERGLKLRVNVAEDMPNVLFGDDIRIKQCILNLLTNAVKYTNEGYIDLIFSWTPINDRELQLKVQVKDTGTGIREENLEKLFNAFVRIEESQFRTTEGTGLGITIVQRLLEKMDSTLNVESEYGSGSTFWFEIRQRIVRKDPIGNLSERMKVVESHNLSLYRETFHAPSARILVVDDMKINLDVFCGLLKRTRIQIDTAVSGNEALGMAHEHHYDIIFIDHRMPEMDGIETLHALRLQKVAGKDEAPKMTPCIALTANAITGAREMYLKEGFVDYISKPVDYVKLEELLMKYLPKHLVQKVSLLQDSTSMESNERDTFMSGFYKIPGINASAALDFCGDLEVLKGAVRDYYDGITMQSDLIEKYAAQGDIKNYTILVHALKSSSRLIGAEQLSKDAAYLEQCGKDNSAEEIERLTPDLLAQFRSLKNPLGLLLGEKTGVNAAAAGEIESAGEEKEAAEREEIPAEQLKGALDALSEFIHAEDFGAAENILSMVEEYKIPLDSEESYIKIKDAIYAKDKATALSLLDAAKKEE